MPPQPHNHTQKNDSTHSLTNQNPIPHPLPQMPHIAHAARFKLLLLQELSASGGAAAGFASGGGGQHESLCAAVQARHVGL